MHDQWNAAIAGSFMSIRGVLVRGFAAMCVADSLPPVQNTHAKQ